MADFPPAPPEEDARDACCGAPGCGSLFHATEDHRRAASRARARSTVLAGTEGPTDADEWPPGYDPAEADELIGRIPGGA